jgi:16S rRNA processing protein RimM
VEEHGSRVPPDRSHAPAGEPVRFLVVGRVLGPVGLGGELRAQILTDFPERFQGLRTLYVGDRLRPYRVKGARVEPGTVLLRLEGVDDAVAAQALANQDLQIPIAEAVPLPRDQYFWHEIIGLEVVADDGARLGRVADILRTGSNDVLVVRDGSREILLPVIEEVVRAFEPEAGRVLVHLIPGLVDED